MSHIDETGFHRTRLDEQVADLEVKARGIFGEEINLDPDSIDGQTIGILAAKFDELEQLAEDVYHSFNPQSATGHALSRLVQLNGIRRTAGRHSTDIVTAFGQKDTHIKAKSLIKSATSDVWETLQDATIPAAGEIDIPVRAQEIGAIAAPAGSINKIDSPTYGWQSVTNRKDADIGRDEESTGALRTRRRASTATPAQAVIDAIIGALLNIPEVRDADCFENDQDFPDARGQAPHSIYCVVDGGDETDIGQAIWRRKTGGTTTLGNIDTTVKDIKRNPHIIKFSRPAEVEIWISMIISPRIGYPTDAPDRIVSEILTWGATEQEIGEEVIYSRVFDPINKTQGFSVDSLAIGKSEGMLGTENITVPFDGVARFDSARISILVL
jgi:uncharacterized phage protein gp47/JayE